MRNALNYLILIFLTCLAGSCLATDLASPKEAQAMVNKAIAYMKKNGLEKTLNEVNNPNGIFIDRDLYVSVIDVGGKVLAHGVNRKLIGVDLTQIKDMDGKPIFKDAIAHLAEKNGTTWVDYKWPNPVTKALESKTTYIARLEDIMFLCGAYKGVVE